MSAHDANRHPSKRVRSSAEHANSPLHPLQSSFSITNLEHHPEFWFDDGNIILVAQNTGFRIYCGLLATQSTVFADMFASASAAADEALKGCPVVHLYDSPYDLAHLLRILLPSYRTPNPEIVHCFDEIFSVVRLAHKYHIQSVQDHGISALQQKCLTKDFDVHFGPQKSSISIGGAQYIGAVNLARLTNTPSMLPFAMYQCCRLGGKLLAGWTRSDGTVEHLSAEDLKCCIDARIVLGRQEAIVAARLFDTVPPGRCKNRGRCVPLVFCMERNVMNWGRLEIHALWDWSMVIGKLGGMCEGCVQVLYERDKAERRRVWDALPQALGTTVEGWGEFQGGEGV